MSQKPIYAEPEQGVKESGQEATERNQTEKKLRESEEKYRLLIENFNDPIWVFDRNGIALVANSPGTKYLGGRPQDYIGRSIYDFLPDKSDFLMERNRRVFETGMGASYEDLFDLPSGKIWMWSNIQPIKDADGKIYAVQIISHDITERKEAEGALKVSVEYLQLHSDLANFLIKLHPSEFGRTIEHVLKSMGELLGVDRGVLTYWPEGDINSREIYSWKREGIKLYSLPTPYENLSYFIKKVTKGEVLSLSDIDELPSEAKSEKEYCLREGVKSGIIIPMLVEGRLLGALSFASFHTKKTWSSDLVQQLQLIGQTFAYSLERKRAEEILRESENKLSSIFDNVNDEIAYLDNQGTIIDVNRRIEDIFGYKPEEVIGKHYTETNFYRQDSIKNLTKNFSTLLSSSQGNLVELVGIRKDGTEIDVEASTSVIRKDGEAKNILVVIRDITKRKKLESQLQQAQRMEAVGTLAGGIAHDFNNLLMGIQGRASLMLLDTGLANSHIEHLNGIEAYVKSAADLTRQLLAFARGGKYEVKTTDINEVLKKSSRLFGRTKKEINILRKYQKDIWPVEVDRGQIEQVLLNLYVNAWQAMPGGGNIYLETENVILEKDYVKSHQVGPGKYVKLTVADTGAGMDQATKQRIFEPFFTTKEMGRGTGLGLASVYGIIKNHGGVISVYSEKGLGTKFNLFLPASEKKVEEKGLTEVVLKGTEKILLVDDEGLIIDVGNELLKTLGYEVLSARSGEEAIEIYKANKGKIHLVILDMVMPDMNGGETFDKLKEIDSKIKVLLSSGYSMNGQASEILGRGCNGFIQKPFNMMELSRKIREVLES